MGKRDRETDIDKDEAARSRLLQLGTTAEPLAAAHVSHEVIGDKQERMAAAAELLAAATQAAALSVACTCGNLDGESWDGGAHFHCFGCKQRGPFDNAVRVAAERRAYDAVRALDRADVRSESEHAARLLRYVDVLCPTRFRFLHGFLCFSYGVTLGFLKAFAHQHGCAAMPTRDVVRDIVKPLTRATRSRFAELADVASSGGVAVSTVFVSHSWAAPFGMLLAALRKALCDDDGVAVWCDLFAVRQWGGNEADLGFEPIVRGTNALILVAVHLDSVASMEDLHVWGRFKRVPEDALALCAFFRIWCLVELAEAKRAGKPVLMLVGDVDVDGTFAPCLDMVPNLYFMVSVTAATASVPADIERELGKIERTIGAAALDSLCRGALSGIAHGITQYPEVMRAACDGSEEAALRCLGAIGEERMTGALIAAAGVGYVAGVRALIVAGAAVEGVCDEHRTPLMAASVGGHTAVIELLVSHRANVNATDDLGTTALICAAIGGHTEALQSLISLGATAYTVGAYGRTALMEAADGGFARAIEVLLLEGTVDANAADHGGRTALLCAATGGHADATRALIRHGADVHAACCEGKTPLMAAAEEGHTAVVELLVHYRASVNATDSSRTSALMCAATEGHAATIARLLELGADADAVDEDGVTAVAWAEDAGHPDAIQVLMRHLHRHDHHDARDGLCGY